MFRQIQAPRRALILRLTLVACAIQAGDMDTAALEIRTVIKAYNNSAEVVRVMEAAFSAGHFSLLGYINVNYQKFQLRLIKAIDRAAKVTGRGQSKAASPDVEEDEENDGAEEQPDGQLQRTKVDPYQLMHHANILLDSRGYASAIRQC